MLRPGLLAQRRVVVGGAPGGRFAAAIAGGLRSLGADVTGLAAEMLADEDAAVAWARERAPVNALVLDAGPTRLAARSHSVGMAASASR